MTIKKQVKNIFHLAWPIVFSQMALAGMITIDTIMASRYSATDMAAVGTALGIWHPISLFGIGVLIALSPVLSRDFGAASKTLFSRHVSNGIMLALLMSLISFVLIQATPFLLSQLAIDNTMKKIAEDYIFYLSLGLPGFCLFALFRVINESIGNTRTIMWIQITALLANIPLNWFFIFGSENMSGFGGAGCGISTTILHYAMFIVLVWRSYKHPICRPYIAKIAIKRVYLKTLMDLFKLGLPIGATLFFEIALFGGVALAIARHGPEFAAAHQIAISFSAITYMLPLSLSMAMTVIIGQHIGHRSTEKAIIATKAGVIVGLCIALFSATFTIFARESIIGIYTNEAAVSQMAFTILIWAAFFQFSDALQCVALGALRGFKDTSIPMYMTLIAYWGIGFPSGYLLAETSYIVDQPMGLEGYWAGLLVSLTSAAFLLSFRLIYIKKQLQQL